MNFLQCRKSGDPISTCASFFILYCELHRRRLVYSFLVVPSLFEILPLEHMQLWTSKFEGEKAQQSLKRLEGLSNYTSLSQHRRTELGSHTAHEVLESYGARSIRVIRRTE